MRHATLFAAAMFGFSGAAQASSFVTLPAMTSKLGPSMIALDATPPARASSFVALGEPAKAPDVETVAVAAIEPKAEATPGPMPAWIKEQIPVIAKSDDPPSHQPFRPVVFRGGLAGDAFSNGVSSPAQAAAAPEKPRPVRTVSADRDAPPPQAPQPPTPPVATGPVMPRVE